MMPGAAPSAEQLDAMAGTLIGPERTVDEAAETVVAVRAESAAFLDALSRFGERQYGYDTWHDALTRASF